jgi:hypothetical protein
MTQLSCRPSFRSLRRHGMAWEGLLGTQYNTSPGELSGLPSAMLHMCSHCWGVTEPEPRHGPRFPWLFVASRKSPLLARLAAVPVLSRSRIDVQAA